MASSQVLLFLSMFDLWLRNLTLNSVEVEATRCKLHLVQVAEYLKPLSQSLPSFVKDTTDSINKFEDLNAKGPFPEGSLLVSWDVARRCFLTSAVSYDGLIAAHMTRKR